MEQYFRTRASVDDEPDLARNRRANDARLKSRFEHIFAKYGKDFEDVGDEIDLDTGEIVVNNGHLESMRHEVDPGKSASSQVLQVLGSVHTTRKDTIPTVGFVDESATENSDEDETASVAGSSGYSSGNADVDEDDSQRPRGASRVPGQRVSGNAEPTDDSQPRLEQQDMASRKQKPGVSDAEQNIHRTSHPTSRSRPPESAPMDLSFLQNSMEAVLAKPGQGDSIDPNVIQALGQSIANQLARFMSNPSKKRKSESSSRRATNDSRWDYPTLPGDRTAQTPSPPPPASSSAALFARSPEDEASIWAAERPRRPKRQRTNLRTTEAVGSAMSDDERDDETISDDQDAPKSKRIKYSVSSNGRFCSHCGDTESRQWRIGPEGGYLCNACGTYFFRYGKSRPFGVLRSAKPGSSQASPASPHVQRPTVSSVDVFRIPLTSTPGSNGYAANTARRMTGDSRYARFTVEEEDAIIKLRAIDQLDWKSIGQKVSNRAENSVQGHYRKIRRRPDFEDRLRLLAQGASKGPALSEQDDEETPTPYQFQEASPSQNMSVNSANGTIPGLRTSPLPTAHASTMEGPDRTKGNEGLGSRTRFSDSEKQLLYRLREGNMEWTQIASYLPGRTLNSLKAMARRLTLSQEFTMSDNAAADESVQPDQLPYTTEDDDLMTLMRDQEGMSFVEMTQYFRGRTEANLALRYERLNGLRSNSTHGEPASVEIPTHANGRPSLPGPDIRQERQCELVSSLEGGESHSMMPPPPRPASQRSRIDATPAPVASARDSFQDAVAFVYNSPAPQTPLFPIPTLSHPPRPLEVGPSAWTATQPTSKGPLPFKPARRSLIPLLPRVPTYTIADPFVSNPSAASDKQKSCSENDTLNAQHRPTRHAKDRARANLKDLYEAFPAVDEPTPTNSSSRGDEAFQVSTAPASQGSLPVTSEEGYTSPSSATNTRAYRTNTTPEPKHRVHYSDEESKLIKRLKEQGLSYAKIAAQIGGRTAISIQNHYYYTYTSTVPNSKAQSSHTTARRTSFSPPLLRQALDNSTRRSSIGTDVELLAIDTARKFLQEHDSGPVGAKTDDSLHLTEAPNIEDTTMHDDGIQTSREGSVSADAESHYKDGRQDVCARFQAFDDNIPSETAGIDDHITSGCVYYQTSMLAPLQTTSARRQTDPESRLRDGRSSNSRRRESSPCVYIDNAVRSEGSYHEPRIFSLDQSAIHAAPSVSRACKSGVDAAPVGAGNSHSRSHGSEVSLPHENRPVISEAPSGTPVEGTEKLDDADINSASDKDELPDSVANEAEVSQHTKALPQKGTKRKRSPGGRSKRVTDFEVADSDSDVVHDPSSQGKADDHEFDEERTTEAPVAPVKRGRGRPRRSIAITATAPEVITISSDPAIKPEAASEANTTSIQPMKRSDKSQQPTPRSKTSRHSNSDLIQRPSAMATPARSGDGSVSFLSRSSTSSMQKTRFESVSRIRPRESPVTRDPSGSARRIILATAASDDGGNEELDELS